jgi:hypothetical protein
MHCIQGSDAHRLDRDPKDENVLGVGDRVTEIQLPELTFAALKEVLLGNDFTRTQPYRTAKPSFDYVQAAQEAGPSIVQSFHESMARKGGHLRAILRDVAAFANTNGGTIYVGTGAKSKGRVTGVDRPKEASRTLLAEIGRTVVPPIDVDIDVVLTRAKNVLRVTVPRGENPPYALDGTTIYVRQESETSRAMRDEIVQLVVRTHGVQAGERKGVAIPKGVSDARPIAPPRTGVEIVDVVERDGTKYYTLKDLRNGNVVQNVTRKSARRLWRYAITEREDRPVEPEKVQWRGNVGLWRSYRRSRRRRYDLVHRANGDKLHIYYGVTSDGIHGVWGQFAEEDK